MSDAETVRLLREIAANEAGLPRTLASRLTGETIGAMRADAKVFARAAGYAAPQPREPSGRFASFNDAIRHAAGHATDEPPEQSGDLGIGKGASATPMAPASVTMNDMIRAASGIRDSAVHDLAERLASERTF